MPSGLGFSRTVAASSGSILISSCLARKGTGVIAGTRVAVGTGVIAGNWAGLAHPMANAKTTVSNTIFMASP